MQKFLISLLAIALLIPEGASAVTRSTTMGSSGRGVSLQLSDPIGSIYNEGESVSFTVQSDTDAYVLVFNIDTEGFVHLVYPREGEPMRMVQANLRYPIPQSHDEELTVAGKKGMEFVFAVSVRDRDAIAPREISRLHESERMPTERRVRVQGDPFLAANEIAGQLVRGIGYSGDVSMAYTYFFVGGAVDFPRYMCEDCDRTGRDPYGVGMPEYAATAVFDGEDRLTYPLEIGFERVYEDGLARPAALQSSYDGTTTTNTVYVTYYPRWYDGFYGWGYWDPWWGWGWRAGWGWGGGFYWGVSWNWGWGYRYPYYHCATPYYGHYYDSYTYAQRSLRTDTSKQRYKSGSSGTLHSAMTTKQDRNMRQRSKGLQTASLGSTGSTRIKSTSSRPAGQPRSLKKATRQSSRSQHSLSSQYKRTYRGNSGRKAYSPRAKKTVRPDSRSRSYRARTSTGSRNGATKVRGGSSRGRSGSKGTKVRSGRSGGRSGSKATYRGGSKARSGSSGKSVRSSGSSRRSSAGKSRGSSGRKSGGGSRGKGRR